MRTVSGVLMSIFQNNAGGTWDNAKESFEKGVEINDKMEYKGSDAHKASVTGDTVVDPFKDTSGPSIAPHIAVDRMPDELGKEVVPQEQVAPQKAALDEPRLIDR